MKRIVPETTPDFGETERREWLDSLDYVIRHGGVERVTALLTELQRYAQQAGILVPFTANTAYVNTITADKQPVYPGRGEIEWRIRSLVRWNALAMVVRANREEPGIGGHISTYASAATLYEVGFNHFFRAKAKDHEGDIIYFQGHASPGIYARAFVEGRLDQKHLENFRRELRPEGGLSSYPHPWLMPDFWEFPTVSMGLSPIMAIYQARFNRYLEDRGLKTPSDAGEAQVRAERDRDSSKPQEMHAASSGEAQVRQHAASSGEAQVRQHAASSGEAQVRQHA